MIKKYWYLTELWICPICGKEIKYKQRKYTKKPKEVTDLIKVKYVYDYCEE